MGHYGSGESRPCRGTALVGHALDRRQPSVIEIKVSAAAVEHGLVVNVTGEGRAVYLWPAQQGCTAAMAASGVVPSGGITILLQASARTFFSALS